MTDAPKKNLPPHIVELMARIEKDPKWAGKTFPLATPKIIDRTPAGYGPNG